MTDFTEPSTELTPEEFTERTPEEVAALFVEEERLDRMPQIMLGEDTVIPVEAPTGVCYM